MAETSAISWTDSTFNPWIGCTKVGPGCEHCYAERDFAIRLGRVKWGAGNPRVRTSAANWRKPVQWNKERWAECGHCGWRGDADSVGGRCPLCPQKGGFSLAPTRRRVFCASLADVFDNEVDPAWQSDLFDLIRVTPHLDWLLLTKRIGNAARFLGTSLEAMPNVWLGATVVNQEEADRDIPKLLAVPARVRFLSIEPMLGPIDLSLHGDTGAFPISVKRGGLEYSQHEIERPRLHWVIAGGESGPHARPMHPDWPRSLRDQCAAAGVPFHFKQWGEWAPSEHHFNLPASVAPGCLSLSGDFYTGFHRDRSDDARLVRVGKMAAGRSLDGRTHDDFPGGGHG